jgi:hypothetical protein
MHKVCSILARKAQLINAAEEGLFSLSFIGGKGQVILIHKEFENLHSDFLSKTSISHQ